LEAGTKEERMGSKKWRAVTSVATVLAFALAILWPQGAMAQPTAAPAAQPAPAQDDATLAQAKAHFEAGKTAYSSGDYHRAIHEFKAAAQLRPSPILDYNIGLAHEKLGHKRVAVKYYQRYLAGVPNASNRAEVEADIAALQQQTAAEPQPPETQQPAPQEGQPQPQAEPEPQPQSYPTYGTYDPYAPAPAGYPTQAPKKKKSRWWIGLIIAGGALVLVCAIAVGVWYAETTSNNVVLGAQTSSPRVTPPSATERTPNVGSILFRF
jgi:tetratricopeptide (TPR) repeat protein